jgi:hypothetical protein
VTKDKNFKYWFVNIFSVIISVLVQILLYRVLSVISIVLDDNTGKHYPMLFTLVPHMIMFIIAFAGVCTTIYYSTNHDLIHAIIAICVCIFLYTLFIDNPLPLLPVYCTGAGIGYLLYRKK